MGKHLPNSPLTCLLTGWWGFVFPHSSSYLPPRRYLLQLSFLSRFQPHTYLQIALLECNSTSMAVSDHPDALHRRDVQRTPSLDGFVHASSVVSDSLEPARLLCPWIPQARTLERVAISFSTGSSQPRDRTCICCTGRQSLYPCATCEAPRRLYTGLFL